MILPEATLGVLGGGQLGRMFTMAARSMGYRVIVLDPDPLSPAAAVANEHLCKDYDDPQALAYLGEQCAAVTTEFENVPVDSLRALEGHCPVRPSAAAVGYAQDRIREKTFIRDCGLATAPFHAVRDEAELDAAVRQVRFPAIMKTAALGYDGKGQRVIEEPGQACDAFEELGGVPCVLEERVDLQLELSVLLARSAEGEIAVYPVAENVHVNGILDTSIVPARIEPAVAERAESMARTLAERLDYCGVLAVELFLTHRGELLVNELAPRPHNSGHYTLDACLTDQFEQQVRMLCGLTPGSTRLLSPVVMVNLLGELWFPRPPRWDELLQCPDAKLHLYGKQTARPGRKMGHVNVVMVDAEAAVRAAHGLRDALAGS
ncbi:MAG: 5-(carboxyamino)imidazole ribonucleotide synthase [Gammaproteobacteria bacterium]